MTNIILTTPEELRAIVSETVSQSLAGFTQPRNEPDNLTPDVAVEVLERHGFLISKARLYKLTAKKEVPFRKYGNKLLFYCFKNVTWLSGAHGAPELLASAAVVGLHLWKRNVLFSIAGGTALYMVLVQAVFA